jgi:hypothetical protein
MSRSTLLCLFLNFCLLVPAHSQTLAVEKHTGLQPFSPVQVVYVIDGSTLTTYNVDPQTLDANPVGTLALPPSTSNGITASPNDHFIYYTWYDGPPLTQHLWVYATDAMGSPQGAPVQEINADKFYGPPAFDPNTNFLYQVTADQAGGGEFENYTIWRYMVNPTTGRINYPEAEAKYTKLPSGAGGSEDCAVFIVGFNAAGTKMYDEIGCSYHGGASSTFNERKVNVETGTLGPDVEVYSWNNSNSGSESVRFVNDHIFDLVIPNDYQPGIDSINIYPVQPNAGARPLVKCTASMLEACGYLDGLNLVHPSGKYVFLGISSSTTQIEKVEFSAGKLVDTSNYIPYTVQAFSPDGTIAYGVQGQNMGLDLEIYGFNMATGGVTPGGVIYLPSNLDPWFTADRY